MLTRVTFVALSCVVCSSAWAQRPKADVAGSADPAGIGRFPGSVIVGYQHLDWDQTQFPLGPEVENNDSKTFKKNVVVEGTITRVIYFAPYGKSPVEVFRNYERALKTAGLKTKFSCEGNCKYLFFRWSHGLVKELTWAPGRLESADGKNGGWEWNSVPSETRGQALYGTIARPEGEVHVVVYVSTAGYPVVDAAGVVVEVAEPKPMANNQVMIDASMLGSSLRAQGKASLYGLYFDTGKAELKPESKPQLEELGKLLKGDPALELLVVGHTDDQGVLDENLALSKRRAEAVVKALVQTQGASAKQVSAHGVGSLAPVASNADEAGRAKNRRVEIVVAHAASGQK